MKTIAASFALLALILSGCQTPTQTSIAQIAVMLATDQVVKGDPQKAAKAVAIAQQVEELAQGDEVTTLEALFALINTRIDWARLTPTEATAVTVLLATVRTELAQRMASGSIPTDQLWRVALVASWIRQAAQPYVPSG